MPKLDQIGRFKARVTASNTYIVQAKSGNFQIALPLEVADGPQAGATITYFKAITDNTIQDIAERLADVFSYEGGLQDLYEGNCPFVGMECSITTKQDGVDDQGKPKIIVDWINPLGGGFKKPEESEFRGFMNRFGGKFQALAKNKLSQMGREPVRTPPAAQAQPAAAGGGNGGRPAPPAATGTEDDLPF